MLLSLVGAGPRAVMSYIWEGNRRSGVALAMHYTPSTFLHRVWHHYHYRLRLWFQVLRSYEDLCRL